MRQAFFLFLVFFHCVLVNSQCRELFFSEYIEAGNNNKALEIYNPSDSNLSLENYRVTIWKNGATLWQPFFSDTLFGFIGPNEVRVLVPDRWDTAGPGRDSMLYLRLRSKAHFLMGRTGFSMDFDGDDAISLDKKNGNEFYPVDIIGKIGEKPETANKKQTGWSDTFPFHKGVGTIYTQNKTLMRKRNITRGVNVNPPYFDPSKEWVQAEKGFIDSLGFHWCDCNKFPAGKEAMHAGIVRIWPNPAGNTLNIQLMYGTEKIKISDVGGREHHAVIKVDSENLQLNLDVSELRPGVYFVTLINSGNQFSPIRFIKL